MKKTGEHGLQRIQFIDNTYRQNCNNSSLIKHMHTHTVDMACTTKHCIIKNNFTFLGSDYIILFSCDALNLSCSAEHIVRFQFLTVDTLRCIKRQHITEFQFLPQMENNLLALALASEMICTKARNVSLSNHSCYEW